MLQAAMCMLVHPGTTASNLVPQQATWYRSKQPGTTASSVHQVQVQVQVQVIWH